MTDKQVMDIAVMFAPQFYKLSKEHFTIIPIGYIQKYRLKSHPWPKQDFTKDIIEHAAGIDFFIGDPEYIGKG